MTTHLFLVLLLVILGLNLDAIEECRKLCGGHGYLCSCGLPELFAVYVPACTYEGDNVVLLLQPSDIGIPLDSTKDLKKKEKELQALETELNRREKELKRREEAAARDLTESLFLAHKDEDVEHEQASLKQLYDAKELIVTTATSILLYTMASYYRRRRRR